ncbi:D-alanine--D-alanine ligase family protein [Bdellovibrionota bacterium FG-2]
MKQQKTRVAVMFGGRSGEHEVSLRSAASVIRNLDKQRFEILPIAVEKSGRWSWVPLEKLEHSGEALKLPSGAPEVVLAPRSVDGQACFWIDDAGVKTTVNADVVFPVIHGTFGEDGCLQGLFELAEVAYVGCGVLASSVGMDKDMAKRVVRDAGLPIVPFVVLEKSHFETSSTIVAAEISQQIMKEFSFPVFVKPANMGSSVGIHKVKEFKALQAALEDAFQYDTKLVIEKALSVREIEMSVLESLKYGEPAQVSMPGEVIPSTSTHEFYSYEAKYLDEKGAALQIPAVLTPEQTKRAQQIGVHAFQALSGEGMARCDLFLDRDSGEFYFNEVNTIPGFTAISMYPKMWEASGLSYADLLTRLVDLALERRKRKSALSREFKG